jgi:hypothetical protein
MGCLCETQNSGHNSVARHKICWTTKMEAF